METEAFYDKQAGEIINIPKESSERKADIAIAWSYIREWNNHTVSDITTLVQNIVESRHSDTDDRLAKLCVDSPILDDDVYEWLLGDQLFIDMQQYRRQIEGMESLSTHHEAARILTQLLAYLRYSDAVYDDVTKLFERIAITGN